MKALGNHLLIELYDCNEEIINSHSRVESLLKEAARISGATIVESVFHKFNPHGVSGVVVIAESHLTIHTWPEYGYCALDIFTCGESVDSEKALRFLKQGMQAGGISVTENRRGILNLPVVRHKPDAK